MLVSIQSKTIYRYERPVSFSPHVLRLFPRQDPGLKVQEALLNIQPDAQIGYQRDLFDNVVARAFFPENSDILSFDIDLTLELHERNPFEFLLPKHAQTLPMTYLPHEQLALSPYLAPFSEEDIVGPDFWPFEEGRPTMEALVDLNWSIYKTITYESREVGRALTPAETKAIGVGACRDMSRMMAAIVRRMGLAVRLVSGYVCEFGKSDADLRSEGSLHAWLEVYLPGAGWLGLDPTNGIVTNHLFIAAAVGLSPDDISPVVGSYFDKEVVPSTLEASIEVRELDS